MKKKIVRRIPIQQLIVYDVMSLNDLRSIDHKQNHKVTTCSNDKINYKIRFLFACHSNIDFFCIDIKTIKFVIIILIDHCTTHKS